MPELIHVFSAGNSNGGGSTAAGSQWFNVTGGHKVGKNTSTSSGQESRSLHGMSGYMYIFIRALALADLCYLFSNLLACYFGSKADLASEFYAKQIQIIQPTWNAFKAEH